MLRLPYGDLLLEIHTELYHPLLVLENLQPSKLQMSLLMQLINVLYGDWIKFPETVQETAEFIDRFQENTSVQVPQIVAAIHGSHIPIKAPKHHKEGYFNRKHFYSMILQGVVGADGRFLDVATGFPGSIHDARVLRMSGFFGRAQRGEILRGPVRHIDGIPVGPLIAADSAYPGLPWLVKP